MVTTCSVSVPTLLPIANLLLLIPAGGLIMYHVTSASKWKLCIAIFFFSFWLSVVWTWFHLYKSKEAELMSRLAQNMNVPKECQSSDFSFGTWLRKTLTTDQADPCVQYHKDLLIDPFWEVPPTEAIAVTVTKFVLAPLELIGVNLGKFFSALFGNVPVTLWPIVSVLMVVGLFVLAILFCGYSIRLPFGLLQIAPGQRIEHRTVVNEIRDNRQAVGPNAQEMTLITGEPGTTHIRQTRILKAKKRKTPDYDEFETDEAE